MITPATFKCDRSCGDCCIYLTVKLYKKDIGAITKAGYSDFYTYDSHIKSPVIKFNENGCRFLGNKEGKFYCKIYNIRPKVCRQYPFVKSNEIESCKPSLLKYKFGKN